MTYAKLVESSVKTKNILAEILILILLYRYYESWEQHILFNVNYYEYQWHYAIEGFKGSLQLGPITKRAVSLSDNRSNIFQSSVQVFFFQAKGHKKPWKFFFFFQVERPEGSNDESNDCNRVKTAQFSTTAIAERLIKSEPQPRLFLLTTALNKNVV